MTESPTVHLARNVAEKQRREFNSYISELANSVPLVANASKHSDDTNSSNLRRNSTSSVKSEKEPSSGELREKAYGLCRDFLAGSWKRIAPSDMVFKPVSGGLSNILFYCSLPSTHTPLNGEPSQVLLRVYGQLHSENNHQESSTITDSVIFMLLSERKLGPKLYGIFPGGRLEEYIPARAMTCQELRDPYLSAIIARKAANVHSLNVPVNKEPTWLFDTIHSWLETVRDLEATGGSVLPEIGSSLLSFDYESEIAWLKSYLKQVPSPIVFCHNDLQEGNILLPEVNTVMRKGRKVSTPLTDDRVVLIDFEYCSYNYRGHDLANHFCEWAFDYSNPTYPHYFADLSSLPTNEEMKHFIREYLKQDKVLKRCSDQEVTEKEIEQLMNEAEVFMLSSHFLWTLWSIKNAFTSEIKFGYWEYGKVRLDAYVAHKKRLLSNNNIL